MAVRLDHFRNIVGVQWRDEPETETEVEVAGFFVRVSFFNEVLLPIDTFGTATMRLRETVIDGTILGSAIIPSIFESVDITIAQFFEESLDQYVEPPSEEPNSDGTELPTETPTEFPPYEFLLTLQVSAAFNYGAAPTATEFYRCEVWESQESFANDDPPLFDVNIPEENFYSSPTGVPEFGLAILRIDRDTMEPSWELAVI
jgi:hypothetical protein